MLTLLGSLSEMFDISDVHAFHFWTHVGAQDRIQLVTVLVSKEET